MLWTVPIDTQKKYHSAAHTNVLNCSSVVFFFAPKHSNQGLKECFWYASMIQTCLIGNKMSVTEHFCLRDNPAFPCSLVYCWLCSCFPSRSGAPDDGRPRYGLCSFSTLLSVLFFCCFQTIIAKYGKMLANYLAAN